MALLILVGYPSSGKSTVAAKIAEYLREKSSKTIVIIADEDCGTFSRNIYGSSPSEKEQRGYLRSQVLKNLSSDCAVVCDSLNYIKGYRYELFCAAKEAKMTYGVVFCDCDADSCKILNERKPEIDRYPEGLVDSLILRFEAPQAKNRWDSPLFTISVKPDTEIEIPYQQIYQTLIQGKTLKPNLSTQTQALAPTNFLHELDKVTQEVVQSILSQQKTALPGDELIISGSSDSVHLKKPWTLAELNRLRRAYIAYTKSHPVEDFGKLTGLFVSFINNSDR